MQNISSFNSPSEKFTACHTHDLSFPTCSCILIDGRTKPRVPHRHSLKIFNLYYNLKCDIFHVSPTPLSRPRARVMVKEVDRGPVVEGTEEVVEVEAEVAKEEAAAPAMVPDPVMVKEVGRGPVVEGMEEVVEAVVEVAKEEAAARAMVPGRVTEKEVDRGPLVGGTEEVVEVEAAPAVGVETEAGPGMDPAVGLDTVREEVQTAEYGSGYGSGYGEGGGANPKSPRRSLSPRPLPKSSEQEKSETKNPMKQASPYTHLVRRRRGARRLTAETSEGRRKTAGGGFHRKNLARGEDGRRREESFTEKKSRERGGLRGPYYGENHFRRNKIWYQRYFSRYYDEFSNSS